MNHRYNLPHPTPLSKDFSPLWKWVALADVRPSRFVHGSLVLGLGLGVLTGFVFAGWWRDFIPIYGHIYRGLDGRVCVCVSVCVWRIGARGWVSTYSATK